MEDQSRVSWSDLPRELWPLIGKCLDDYVDILRFRSVCRVWRNSLPKHEIFSKPIHLRSIIYRFTPLDHHPSSKDFLAMIRHRGISNYKSNHEMKRVNFLDFQIKKAAIINTDTDDHLLKILVFPQRKHKNMMVGLNSNGWLMFSEYEENPTKRKWTRINENADCDDAIVYNDQIYTIDRQGKVFSINSSMKLVQISDPIGVDGYLKHLVECEGEIYAVDRFVEGNKSGWYYCDLFLCSNRRWCNDMCMEKSVDFKVHRLDQRRKRWVEVKNLGNRAIVLGEDCFVISAPNDLEGFERNCIYFLNHVNMSLTNGEKYNRYVFDLEKSTIRKSNVRILMLPSLLRSLSLLMSGDYDS